MQTKIVLIRHGATDWNKEKKYCGYKDVPLNAQGEKQAELLAKRLATIHFDAVYASDLKRAVKTARLALGRVKIIKIKDLREMNFGVMEGLSHEQILKKYALPYTKWLKEPFKKHDIPEAEHMADFRKRITRALKQIVRDNRGKTVAVVCHGGTISVLLTSLLKRKGFWQNVPGSTSVSIIEYTNNKPVLKLFNCTKHLKE